MSLESWIENHFANSSLPIVRIVLYYSRKFYANSQNHLAFKFPSLFSQDLEFHLHLYLNCKEMHIIEHWSRHSYEEKFLHVHSCFLRMHKS